jgi:hypothetical protein
MVANYRMIVGPDHPDRLFLRSSMDAFLSASKNRILLENNYLPGDLQTQHNCTPTRQEHLTNGHSVKFGHCRQHC